MQIIDALIMPAHLEELASVTVVPLRGFRHWEGASQHGVLVLLSLPGCLHQRAAPTPPRTFHVAETDNPSMEQWVESWTSAGRLATRKLIIPQMRPSTSTGFLTVYETDSEKDVHLNSAMSARSVGPANLPDFHKGRVRRSREVQALLPQQHRP